MWSTVHIEGGPRRVNHAAAAIGSVIYSFGGYCSGSNYDASKDIDVFVLDTRTYRWTPLCQSTGSKQGWMTGESRCRTESLLGRNDTANHSKDVPFQRYGHTVVTYGDRIYLWGGRNDQVGSSPTLHEFNPKSRTWARIDTTGTVPSPRDGHTAVVAGDRMYVFGGFECRHRKYTNEVYAYDFKTRDWIQLATDGDIPEERDFHAACVLNGVMYVYGGRGCTVDYAFDNNDTYSDDLYALDLTTQVWHRIELAGKSVRPPGRRSHTMWTREGKLYIFGGYNSRSEQHYNDLWSFDPATRCWTLLCVQGQQPRARRRHCTILVDNRTFVFGGTTPSLQPNRRGGLCDLSDLVVLDYSPKLKLLAARQVAQLQSRPYLGKYLEAYLLNIVKPNGITSGRQGA